MALQRNLKALGTFGYQTTARGNPVYVQYIPRTLRYARENLYKYRSISRACAAAVRGTRGVRGMTLHPSCPSDSRRTCFTASG